MDSVPARGFAGNVTMQSLFNAVFIMLSVVATLQWPGRPPRRKRRRRLRIVRGDRG